MMVRTLIPLAEHNAAHAAAYRWVTKYPRPNGLACPVCGQELSDETAAVLLSDPPHKQVVCGHCGFHGTRVAG